MFKTQDGHLNICITDCSTNTNEDYDILYHATINAGIGKYLT